MIVCDFVYALGSGFGSIYLVRGTIKYRIVIWSSKEDTNSFNWQEFENLVCEIEEAEQKVGLVIILFFRL